jgi:hypothetical protein
VNLCLAVPTMIAYGRCGPMGMTMTFAERSNVGAKETNRKGA